MRCLCQEEDTGNLTSHTGTDGAFKIEFNLMIVCMWILIFHRQQDLFRVLKAYTLYRPEEGYCQAQAPIAAVLLMHMPAEVLFTFPCTQKHHINGFLRCRFTCADLCGAVG